MSAPFKDPQATTATKAVSDLVEAAATNPKSPRDIQKPSSGEASDVNDPLESISEERADRVAMLAEQSPVYRGLSTAAAEEMRSRILASLTVVSPHDPVVPIALEDLQTSSNPRIVAAAARTLRTLRPVSDNAIPILIHAMERMSSTDDVVHFEPGSAPTTAFSEISRTLAAFGQGAPQALKSHRLLVKGEFFAVPNETCEKANWAIEDAELGNCCCASPSLPQPHTPVAPNLRFPSVKLQDQDGVRLEASAYLSGRPSIIAFFYTRCMNPTKCSLTITKLAALVAQLRQMGLLEHVNIAAVSYDPAFDTPERLHRYGSDRGLMFCSRVRVLRTTENFDTVASVLNLNVGYGATTVNQHGRDMFLLDTTMMMKRDYSRSNWTPVDVLTQLQELLSC